MAGWIVWFFAAPLWFVFGGLLSSMLPFDVDVSVAVCLVSALYVRTQALPGLLFCAALARGLVADGDLPLHFLALALPVAALLPLRSVIERHSLSWQCAAAAFLALTVPRLGGLLAELSGQPSGAGTGFWSIVAAAFVMPALALPLRKLPPLSLFVEQRS